MTRRTHKHALTRRGFLGASAALGAFTFIPRYVLGATPGRTGPSDKLNLAFVGVGGRGGANLGGLEDQNCVALCDVDAGNVAKAAQTHPGAKQYRDYRKMLDEMDKSIDAVSVSTPDHAHAVIAMAAIKRGKHVYCEKPLAHSVAEVRALMKAAHEYKVVTQLGNQGHSSNTIRLFCEWVWDGAIGDVHTVHAACAKVHSRINDLPKLKEQHPVPASLDYDLWLGPAQFRPYHPMYLPNSWRDWTPFGCGTIGDWVCHVVDPVFWALDLGAPATILAQAKGYDPKLHGDTFAAGNLVRFEFPAKGARKAVTLWWHDGKDVIPRPEKLDADKPTPDTGAVVLGTKGGITYGSHGAGGVRMFPESDMKAYGKKLPAQKIPRVKGHHQDWVQAIRTKGKAGSNFDYGGPLTEIALLGNIAMRFMGTELKWDSAAMKFTNCPEANALLTPTFRTGWSL